MDLRPRAPARDDRLPAHAVPDLSLIAAYVSGHGFGHSTRTAEVLRLVRELRPEVPITVVTSAPERLFKRPVAGHVGYRALTGDVGLVQRSALEIDEDATVARTSAFAAIYPALVRQESAWLRESGARLVIGDIPPLAFDAAGDAGLPAVGIANFSWDWIYRHFAPRHPGLTAAADAAARAYARAALLLALPFAGDLSAFPRREAIPLVARRPRVAKAEARFRLGLVPADTVVLVSFGGFGAAVDRRRAESDPSLRVVFSDDVADRLDGLDLGYEDLVGGADVVVTKPGYGIVSDAVGAGTRLVYSDRGDFPEYPIMVREMASLLPAVYLPSAQLMAGDISAAVHEVLARPSLPPPDVSGAAVAARRIARML